MAQHERAKGLPAEIILDYLGGITFPCSKDQLVSLAVDQNAPVQIVEALSRLPDEPFSSFDDIMRHYKRWL